jgi:hypothetical protein
VEMVKVKCFEKVIIPGPSCRWGLRLHLRLERRSLKLRRYKLRGVGLRLRLQCLLTLQWRLRLDLNMGL